jgi:hypothetical protein
VNEQFPVTVAPAVRVRLAGHVTVRRLVGPVLLVTVVDIATVPAKPVVEAGRLDSVTMTLAVPPGGKLTLVEFVV